MSHENTNVNDYANVKPIGGNKKTKDIDYYKRTSYESF